MSVRRTRPASWGVPGVLSGRVIKGSSAGGAHARDRRPHGETASSGLGAGTPGPIGCAQSASPTAPSLSPQDAHADTRRQRGGVWLGALGQPSSKLTRVVSGTQPPAAGGTGPLLGGVGDPQLLAWLLAQQQRPPPAHRAPRLCSRVRPAQVSPMLRSPLGHLKSTCKTYGHHQPSPGHGLRTLPHGGELDPALSPGKGGPGAVRREPCEPAPTPPSPTGLRAVRWAPQGPQRRLPPVLPAPCPHAGPVREDLGRFFPQRLTHARFRPALWPLPLCLMGLPGPALGSVSLQLTPGRGGGRVAPQQRDTSRPQPEDLRGGPRAGTAGEPSLGLLLRVGGPAGWGAGRWHVSAGTPGQPAAHGAQMSRTAAGHCRGSAAGAALEQDRGRP